MCLFSRKRQENLKLLQTRNFSKKKDRHRAERETLGPDKNYAAVPVDLNGQILTSQQTKRIKAILLP